MPGTQHDAVQERFNRTAEAYVQHGGQRDAPDKLSKRLEFAGVRPTDDILDVACGPGAFVLAAAPRVRFARGIDLTPGMLRQARQGQRERGIENACFDRGEAERLPYADGTFDLVCCQFALHHMPHPEASLCEMVRVTRPGGRLLLMDSLGPEDPATLELRDRIERLRDASHTNSLSVAGCLALFKKNQLAVLNQKVRKWSHSLREWMLRAGVKPSDQAYQLVRRAIEESMPGDRAGFAPEVQDDDLLIQHYQGMFLLEKRA
jgi:ubiquinone/menaquinone biosynthesis C-methylase UbiE